MAASIVFACARTLASERDVASSSSLPAVAHSAASAAVGICGATAALPGLRSPASAGSSYATGPSYAAGSCSAIWSSSFCIDIASRIARSIRAAVLGRAAVGWAAARDQSHAGLCGRQTRAVVSVGTSSTHKDMERPSGGARGGREIPVQGRQVFPTRRVDKLRKGRERTTRRQGEVFAGGSVSRI